MQVMVEQVVDVQSNGKDRKRREKLATRACVLCNQAHTACDDERPCKRCVSKGIAHLCKDAEPRKRGRPAKSPEQYDLEIQMAQRRSAQAMQTYQSMPILSLPSNNPFTFTLSNDMNLDYDTTSILDIPLSPASFEPMLSGEDFTQIVDSPPMQLPETGYNSVPLAQNITPPSLVEHIVPVVPVVPDTVANFFPSVPQPLPSPAPTSDALYPPGFSCMKLTPCSNKFSEEHLTIVFQRLANRAGFSELTPDLRVTLNKVMSFYAPLVQQYGTSMMEMCPVRLMSVSQMINENSLPVIVAGCFFMLTANSPAFDLTGLKKAELGKSANWKFIFDIIHRDDVIPFVKRSVDCLTSFSDLDRMKVRLTVPDGVFECVVSETVHRNSNGVPLFSSFTFIRIDDLK